MTRKTMSTTKTTTRMIRTITNRNKDDIEGEDDGDEERDTEDNKAEENEGEGKKNEDIFL